MDSPEDIIIKTRSPILSPANTSISPPDVLEEPKKECPQTPPRIRLESILEDSPSSILGN
jgi:hypothetical protein